MRGTRTRIPAWIRPGLGVSVSFLTFVPIIQCTCHLCMPIYHVVVSVVGTFSSDMMGNIVFRGTFSSTHILTSGSSNFMKQILLSCSGPLHYYSVRHTENFV